MIIPGISRVIEIHKLISTEEDEEEEDDETTVLQRRREDWHAIRSGAEERRTTVRYYFDTMPDKTKFIQSVCNVVPKEGVKCIQSLPGNQVDLTLRSEQYVWTLIHEGLRVEGMKGPLKPKALGVKTTFRLPPLPTF